MFENFHCVHSYLLRNFRFEILLALPSDSGELLSYAELCAKLKMDCPQEKVVSQLKVLLQVCLEGFQDICHNKHVTVILLYYDLFNTILLRVVLILKLPTGGSNAQVLMVGGDCQRDAEKQSKVA